MVIASWENSTYKGITNWEIFYIVNNFGYAQEKLLNWTVMDLTCKMSEK